MDGWKINGSLNESNDARTRQGYKNRAAKRVTGANAYVYKKKEEEETQPSGAWWQNRHRKRSTR